MEKNLSGKLERPPALDRIVSADLTEEERQEVLVYFKKLFDEQDIEELKSGEIALSPEQRESLELGNSLVNEELSKYGFKAMDVPVANVHIMDDARMTEFGKRGGFSAEEMKRADAMTSPYDQTILIRRKRRSRYDFLTTSMHEMSHLKSFISMNPAKIDKETSLKLSSKGRKEIDGAEEEGDFLIKARRLGWNIEEAKIEGRTYFHNVDEALIEDMTMRIMREKGPEVFGDEFKASENLRLVVVEELKKMLNKKDLSRESRMHFEGYLSWFDNDVRFLPKADTFLERYNSGDGYAVLDAITYYTDDGLGEVEEFVYGRQRKLLNKLIEELYERNKEFGSKEDVRSLFIEGGFNGNIMPVARLVRKTFGKDAFERLGMGEDITS